MHQGNDRTAKWLIDRHGDSILHLAGITGFTRWQALPAETVAPKRLPDGLIEVWFPGQRHPDLVLVEIETYPDKDVDRQVFEDLEVVHLTRGVTPEVVCLVLKPKVNLAVTGRATRSSRRGSTTVTAMLPVVNVWELDADELLAQGDPGLIPWVPLAKSNRSRAEILDDCRDRLNAVADPRERKDLTVVTAILAGVANEPKGLLNLFGGADAMIESPVLDEILEIVRQRERAKAEVDAKVATLREGVLANLEARFGSVPGAMTSDLAGVTDAVRLREVHRLAVTCPDVATFQDALTPGSGGKCTSPGAN